MIPETLSALAVPIDSLTPYQDNPRRGDLEAIKESLAANSQYRPIVASRRTGEVLAGNHTLRAAEQLGWTRNSAAHRPSGQPVERPGRIRRRPACLHP